MSDRIDDILATVRSATGEQIKSLLGEVTFISEYGTQSVGGMKDKITVSMTGENVKKLCLTAIHVAFAADGTSISAKGLRHCGGCSECRPRRWWQFWRAAPKRAP